METLNSHLLWETNNGKRQLCINRRFCLSKCPSPINAFRSDTIFTRIPIFCNSHSKIIQKLFFFL